MIMDEPLVYEYAVIRYVPDVEREEFVNVGLLMMCKRRRWVKARVRLVAERLATFPAAHTTEEIELQLATFTRTAEGAPEAGPVGQLPAEERFRWLTAVKSACLQTSRPHPGLTNDLEATFERLFSTLVL